jgi:hypothetical protein
MRRKQKTERNKGDEEKLGGQQDAIPPGATRKAFDRENLGGGPPGSPLGDPHATDDDESAVEPGALPGSDVGRRELPDEEELAEERYEDEHGPFAGRAGGAVGGSPAEFRASGGKIHGGFSPGSGSTRGDSTLGSEPEPRKKGRSSTRGKKK